jgi:hypothetical protein
MVQTYDHLYDLRPGDFAYQNAEAHPGGGTETVEVPSGEGVVEDQFEAHLRAMEIAYREPTAAILASLANGLDSLGFEKRASQVDSVLESFVALGANESARDKLIELVARLAELLSKAKKSWKHEFFDNPLKDRPENLIKAENIVRQLQVGINKANQDWPALSALAKTLLPENDPEMWDGSMFTDGLEDLRWDARDRREFIKSVDGMVKLIDDIQFPDESGRAREAPVAPKAKPSVVYKLSPQQKKARDFMIGKKSEVDNTFKSLEALVAGYSSSILEPEMKALFEKRVINVYEKYGKEALQYYNQKKGETVPDVRDPRVYTVYLNMLTTVELKVNNMMRHIETQYNEIKAARNKQ